jgi:hypothetical protein
MTALLEGIKNTVASVVDRIFGIGPLPTDTLTARRARLIFYAVVLIAAFLSARLAQVMVSPRYPNYLHGMLHSYYDPSTQTFFGTIATAAATFWVISVGILTGNGGMDLTP